MKFTAQERPNRCACGLVEKFNFDGFDPRVVKYGEVWLPIERMPIYKYFGKFTHKGKCFTILEGVCLRRSNQQNL